MSSPLPYNRQNALASTIAADNASSIAGKIVLTIGVAPGSMGSAFVEEVAKHKPALLILAGRTPSKLQATADKIKANPESSQVEIRLLNIDLASQKQIREAAKEVLNYKEDRVDVLVNRAGLMAGPFRTTAEGIELQFGSNYLGYFLFTNLIMPKLLASKSPCVVNVSSNGHRYSGIRFDDPSFQDGKVYDEWEAYGQSKTANILFSRALAEKLGPKGLKSFSLHPGVVATTSLTPGFSDEDFAKIVAKDKEIGYEGTFDMKNLDEAAATDVVAAFDTRLDDFNGAYLENGNLSNDLWKTAKNPEDVDKLWKLSEKLVGESFTY